MRILVTGAAGFIGFHTVAHLMESGHAVTGIDNLNEYYDVRLKEERLQRLKGNDLFEFRRLDIVDQDGVSDLFNQIAFDRVIHLAAQAGVRHSLNFPEEYIESNISGFLNILEGCRHHSVPHLLYASSSSVYGANKGVPFSETDGVDHPVSVYGATKRANELMAHAYSHLFGIPATGLRFFTVYGPWGRPDMAYFLFAKAITEGRTISLFNRGNMKRDFTYIDDVVEIIGRLLDLIPAGTGDTGNTDPLPCEGNAPFSIYNIGRSEMITLVDFVDLLEKELGEKAEIELLPLQSGDVLSTQADVSRLEMAVGTVPATSLQDGIRSFIRWFREFY
jgi:UDP-glucuronate 4-epimerase